MLISGERRTAHFRAHERRHVQVEATLWRAGQTEDEPATVKVLNIGLGGVGFAGHVKLPLEDRVMLTLASPSLLDPLALPARVAWVQAQVGHALRYGGLAFEAPDRSALLTLFQLVGTLTF